VWAADGKKIVLEVLEDAEPAVYALRIVDVDSGRSTQVFAGKIEDEFSAFIGTLSTAPVMAEGQVLFTWPHNARPAIWTVTEGGSPKVLRERASSPSVSKGKLSYVSFEGRQQVVSEEVTQP
jgi:hypothetical protein